MKLAITLSLLAFSLTSSALPAANLRQTVQKFFANYGLIGDWDQFQKEQGKLLSSYLVTVNVDHRGTKTFAGPEGYFASLGSWGEAFATGDDFRTEIVSVTASKVTVRLHGTLTLKLPTGHKPLRDDQHRWTEIFTFGRNGRIERLEVKMNLHL